MDKNEEQDINRKFFARRTNVTFGRRFAPPLSLVTVPWQGRGSPRQEHSGGRP